MTEDFIKIKDAKEALKGSFKATVIKVGDMKAGTKNGKDWIKKVFTLEDDTDNVELVAWDDETTQFKLGYLYEIVNPWWKVYEGKVSVQVGKYGTAKVIGSDKSIPETPPPPPQQTLTEKPKTEQKPDESKIEKLTDIELGTVEDATVKLLAISLAVGEKVKEFTEEPDRTFVMEATKIIYDRFFASNFKKASDTR